MENKPLRATMPKSKELIQLSELVDRYESLSNLLRQERTRLKNNVFDSNVVIQSIKDMIACVKAIEGINRHQN
jgi:N-acetylglutamate synthase-like GNAT family acetyltransferase